MMDQDDKAFFDLWEDEDKPDDSLQKAILENAKLRAELEASSKPQVEKVYIVRGHQVFVCHKGQIKVEKKTGKDGEPLRDIDIRGARMVVYGRDGLRRADA